jgi:hypothetical protein
MSKAEQLRQAIEWVKAKAEQDQLAESWQQRLLQGPFEVYRQMGEKRLGKFVALHLRGLLERLEHQSSFEVEQIKQTYLTYLEKGLSMQELVGGVEIMHQALIKLAREELAAQPQVREVLLNRVSYIVNLLKTTIAAALIDFQSRS